MSLTFFCALCRSVGAVWGCVAPWYGRRMLQATRGYVCMDRLLLRLFLTAKVGSRRSVASSNSSFTTCRSISDSVGSVVASASSAIQDRYASGCRLI